jgi:hypothetical protein
MTEPRDPRAKAAGDPGPEVKPEVISDLDVTGERAGCLAGSALLVSSPVA